MMNEATCAVGAIDRQEKHIELAEAVNSIDSILMRLDELAERISGPTPKPDCNKELKDRAPTLADVLNGAPNAIRSKVEEAQRRIDCIQELIF